MDLDENTTIEIRTSSQQNPSNLGMTITSTDLTVDAGEQKQICDGDNVVLDGSPNTNNATYSWTGGSFVSGSTTLTPTVSPTTNSTYTITATLGECTASSDVLVNVDIHLGQSEFGNQVWNVYGYNGNNRNLNNAYRGFYVQPNLASPNLGINTEQFWTKTLSPSSSGTTKDNSDLWNGCPVNVNNHTFIHKRKGFPCGNYTFTMNRWNDEVRVLIDGTIVWSCTTNSGAANCTDRTFTVQLDVDSEVEIQVFENTGTSNLNIELIPVPISSLTPLGVYTRKCKVSGIEWVRFFDENDKLIASINPNGSDLGNVTMTSYVSSPMIMEACNTPHPLYYIAYMGRRWVMSSDLYPNGANFNNNVTVRLPYDENDLFGLNAHAQLVTIQNMFDGGDVEPVVKENIMLTKITGGVADGTANSLDCGATFLGIDNTGRGLEMESILNTEYVDFEIQQFSEFFLHKNNGGSALPVELTNFSASCENNASIKWTTASELNSDYFLVEKSRDGHNWTLVEKQNAAGNSNAEINYSFVDEDRWNGLSYYRLRQVDFDGKEEVFGPISVSCTGNENSMTVYPNPNNGTFIIEISSDNGYSDVQLFMTDATGKIVVSEEIDISNGTTQFTVNKLDLSKGVYLVSIIGVDNQLKPVKVVLN
ncbi:T9SS type A sorting domain-containing protein [Brumimicrobium glaciale]|uniref:T9SS type A sorting domain-containing protein n=1 Tax=Brumimicrobium glaciale TaxID=200475 RepID=A0A4Q4KR15_9FLAO|nr:T9SS type A sorting domain-containing protein [Brumimicrobium glaciale]RYM35986.1 T9SS type A sorting domain-containing protein [Brumimicrobium glaciale]